MAGPQPAPRRREFTKADAEQRALAPVSTEALVSGANLLSDHSVTTLLNRLVAEGGDCALTSWSAYMWPTLQRRYDASRYPDIHTHRQALAAAVANEHVLPVVEIVASSAAAVRRRVLPLPILLSDIAHWIAEVIVIERVAPAVVTVSIEHFDSMRMGAAASVVTVFDVFSRVGALVNEQRPELLCVRTRWPINLQRSPVPTECGVWVLWYVQQRLRRQALINVALEPLRQAETLEQKLALREQVLRHLLRPTDTMSSDEDQNTRATASAPAVRSSTAIVLD